MTKWSKDKRVVRVRSGLLPYLAKTLRSSEGLWNLIDSSSVVDVVASSERNTFVIAFRTLSFLI